MLKSPKQKGKVQDDLNDVWSLNAPTKVRAEPVIPDKVQHLFQQSREPRNIKCKVAKLFGGVIVNMR